MPLLGKVVDMDLLGWGALIVGAGLILSGVRAIRLREARVPEQYQGRAAVRLGWLWITLGILFMLSALYDIALLKTLFKVFLEAAS
jgi:hypothetical protein